MPTGNCRAAKAIDRRFCLNCEGDGGEMTRYNPITTALDRNLLSRPFEVQTNWHVLTGAACSGKTTLIEGLAGNGFEIIPESAREYFQTEMAKGRTAAEIRRNSTALQRGIAALQLKFERGFQTGKIAFLDRAVPDSLTFYRVFGMDPNEVLPECFHHRYVSVFILERLPFHRSRVLGPEGDTVSDFLDEWLVRDYNALGYKVTRVPVLPPHERIAFLLDRLAENGQV